MQTSNVDAARAVVRGMPVRRPGLDLRPYGRSLVVSETEVPAAIAQQEDHIKRVTSCLGQVGRVHAWRPAGDPTTGEGFARCVVCGVSELSRPFEEYVRRVEGGRL